MSKPTMYGNEDFEIRKSLGVQITPSQQMISSCSGALLTSFFVTPLDVVKIRLQAQSKPFSKGQCFLYCNGLMDHVCACLNGNSTNGHWYKKPSHFEGTIDAFIKIARYEGITSLWSGLPPTLVMAVPATVIYFTSYDQLKYKLGYLEGHSSQWWKPMTAGALARVWAVACISPIELIRTKMQSEQLSYTQVHHAVKASIRQGSVLSLWRGLGPSLLRDVPFSGKSEQLSYTQVHHAVKASIKQGSVLSLWRGLGPSLLRDVPFSAIYWFGYESTKAYVLKTKGRRNPSFTESFLSGALSGTIAAVLTLPFDVIKTHRQIELGQAEIMKGKQISSTWLLIRKLYMEQGLRSLFVGLVPRVIKVAPACAIMISTYEYCKYFFRTFNESKVNSSLSRTVDNASSAVHNVSSVVDNG